MRDEKIVYGAVEAHIVACNRERGRKPTPLDTPLGLLTENNRNSAQISFI